MHTILDTKRREQRNCSDAVIATGPAAFALTSQAITSLRFLDALHDKHTLDAFGDPGNCINEEMAKHDLKQLVVRHFRCAQSCLDTSL
jgi:hypothetical protein